MDERKMYSEEQVRDAMRVVLSGANGSPGLTLFQEICQNSRDLDEDGVDAVDEFEFMNDVVFQLRVGV